jgi:hypothetical protein
MFVIYTSDETLYHTERTKRDVVAGFVTSNLIQEYRMSNDYIYESPDGGKTVTRRKFGDNTKETIITPSFPTTTDVPQTHAEFIHYIDDIAEISTAKFKVIKERLMSAQLRAHWFKDHNNEHTISDISRMVEELEHEFHCASLRAKHDRLPTDND